MRFLILLLFIVLAKGQILGSNDKNANSGNMNLIPCDFSDIKSLKSLYFNIGVKNCVTAKNDSLGGAEQGEYFIDLDALPYRKKMVGYSNWKKQRGNEYITCNIIFHYPAFDDNYYSWKCTGLDYPLLNFESDGVLICTEENGQFLFKNCRMRLKLIYNFGNFMVWLIVSILTPIIFCVVGVLIYKVYNAHKTASATPNST